MGRIEYDVLVVGGGPAGSTAAAGLARRGYAVALIDRATFPREKTCAEYCSPGVSDVLGRSGIWPEILPRVRQTPGMVVFVRDRPLLPIAYQKAPVPRLAFTVSRMELDETLLRHAQRQGVDVRPGLTLRGIERTGGCFRVSAGSSDGSSLVAHASVVVAADGIHSDTTRKLGVRSWNHWPRRLGLVTRYSGDNGAMDWGEMHVGRGVYCGLASLPDGTVTVGLAVGLDEARNLGVRGQKLPEWALNRLPRVEQRLAGARMLQPARGVGPMARRVDRVAGEGFLLVGDAAGFLDPFTGEGIFRAVRGAELAVDAVDAGLKTRAKSEFPDLTPYAETRHSALAGKERVTWLIQLALTRPALFASIAKRFSDSESVRNRFGNVLGDVEAPGSLVRLDVLSRLAWGVALTGRTLREPNSA